MRTSALLLLLVAAAQPAAADFGGVASLRAAASSGEAKVALSDLLSVEETEGAEAAVGGRRRRRRWHRPHHHWPHWHRPHFHHPHIHVPHIHHPHIHVPHLHHPHVHADDIEQIYDAAGEFFEDVGDFVVDTANVVGDFFKDGYMMCEKWINDFGNYADFFWNLFYNTQVSKKHCDNGGAELEDPVFFGKSNAVISAILKPLGIIRPIYWNGNRLKEWKEGTNMRKADMDFFDPSGTYTLFANLKHPADKAKGYEFSLNMVDNLPVPRVQHRTDANNADTDQGSVGEVVWVFKKGDKLKTHACEADASQQCAKLSFHFRHSVGKAKDFHAISEQYHGVSTVVWMNNPQSVMSLDAAVFQAEKSFLSAGLGSGLLEEEDATGERTTVEAEEEETYQSYLAGLEAQDESLGSLLQQESSAGSEVAWAHFEDDVNAAWDAVVKAADWVVDFGVGFVKWCKQFGKLLREIDRIFNQRDRMMAAGLSQGRVAMQLIEMGQDKGGGARLKAAQAMGLPPCCVDDPLGGVAATGMDCAMLLQAVGGSCIFDMAGLNPLLPAGSLVYLACPVTCGVCPAGFSECAGKDSLIAKAKASLASFKNDHEMATNDCLHFDLDDIAARPGMTIVQGSPNVCESDGSSDGATCFADGYLDLPLQARILAYHATAAVGPQRTFQVQHSTLSAWDEGDYYVHYLDTNTHLVLDEINYGIKPSYPRAEVHVDSAGCVACTPGVDANCIMSCDPELDGRSTYGYIQKVKYGNFLGQFKIEGKWGRRFLYTGFEKMYNRGTHDFGKPGTKLDSRIYGRWTNGNRCGQPNPHGISDARVEDAFYNMKLTNIGYAPPGTHLNDWWKADGHGGAGDYFQDMLSFLDTTVISAKPYGCASSFLNAEDRGRASGKPTNSVWGRKSDNDYDFIEMAVWAHFLAEAPMNTALSDIGDHDWTGNWGF